MLGCSGATARRIALLLALPLLVVAAACGDDASSEEDTSTEVTATEDTATEPGSATVEATGTSEGTATPTESTAGEAATRTVELRGGPVEVPADPQRVVVLQSFVLPHVLSVGVEPVGVGLSDVSVPPNEILPPWLDARLPDDVAVFSETEPDLELIAGLDPDLIVAFRDEGNLEQLQAIAPVAVIDRIAMEWRELTQGVAEVFNRGDRFDEFMAQYEARLETFREETLPELGDRTVSTFRVRGSDEIRIEVLDSFPGQILQAAGVARPEAQNVEGDTGFGYLEVSTERFAEADADLMFAITNVRSPQTKEDLAAISQTPVWQSLAGVQAGQVFEVDGADWFGGHPLAAIALLDDLAAAVDGSLAPYTP